MLLNVPCGTQAFTLNSELKRIAKAMRKETRDRGVPMHLEIGI